MPRHWLFFAALLVLPMHTLAQPAFQPAGNDVVVRQADGRALPLAWAGGLNAPQFNTFSLNGDSLPDLLVFDRSDNRLLPFVQQPPASSIRWRYAPGRVAGFPTEKLQSYLVVRDFDRDGRPDLFTDADSRIRAFQNISSTGGPPAFQDLGLLRSSFGKIFHVRADVPGLADLDNDGDLDLLAYRPDGVHINWHRNQSMERFGHPDSLRFSLASDCYGNFVEDYNPQTASYSAQLLPDTCSQVSGKTAHVGGTALPLHLNGDSLPDLLISDNGNATMVALFNGGTPDYPWMTSFQENFPAQDSSIRINVFPAAWPVDLAGDSVPELIAAPNGTDPNTAPLNDHSAVWFYANTGSPLGPAYHRTDTAFLQADMLDLGSNLIPRLADLTADGRPDLILTAQSSFYSTTSRGSRLAVYEGQGSGTALAFRFRDSTLPGLSANPLPERLAPAFGDLDNDGDPDLILAEGKQHHRLWHYENTAPPGQPAQFSLRDSNFLNLAAIDPFALEPAPLFHDLTGNGQPELIAGIRPGRLLLFEQVNGSYQLVSTDWGQLQAADTSNTPYVTPKPGLLDVNADGSLELLIGLRDGRISIFSNLRPTDGHRFRHLGYVRNGEDFGRETAPAGLTLAGNDSLRQFLVVGTKRGGARLFSRKLTDSLLTRRPETQPLADRIRVWPNASTGLLHLEAPPNSHLQVWNAEGRLLRQQVLGQANTHEIHLQDLPAGMYVLRFQWENQTHARRVLLMK